MCMLLSACGQEAPVNERVKKTPSATDPRYSVESMFTGKKGEFAVTYMDAEITEQRGFRGSETVSTYVNTVVEIVNTGTIPLYIPDFWRSTYVLTDEAGNMEEQMFTNFFPRLLMPGETGYMGNSLTLTDIWKPEVELEVVLNIDKDAGCGYTEESFNEFFTPVEVSEFTISNTEDGHIVISGSVKNTSDKKSYINIDAVILDEQNVPLCVISTYADKVLQGETVEFSGISISYGAIL